MKYSVIAWCFLLSSMIHAKDVDYLKDIKPILSKHCYQCHGGEKQRAGLRLDTAHQTLQGGNSGAVIQPGKSASSSLIQAVKGGNDDLRAMPPRGDKLTKAEIDLLVKWVDQGAKAPEDEAGQRTVVKSDHWAFQAIQRYSLPTVKDSLWPITPIDRFILAKLEQHKIAPAPEASRSTLLRRVYFDLIGLPPTPEAVDAFLNDTKPGAYERVVDQLLASPHYGEKWGRHWLDAARYADSNGFTIDGARSIWPYRDYVIESFNENKPFDQFTIEQLAGDLLPKATREQQVATGFHRNTLFNQEGGIDREQFRVEFTVDRVNTTGTVFLGLTIGCAQCHDHKFDPLSQREFYQFFAFFNSVDEPRLSLPTKEQNNKRQQLQAEIDKLNRAKKQLDTTSAKGQTTWEANLTAKAKALLSKDVQNIFQFAPNSRSRQQKEKLTRVYQQSDLIKHIIGGIGSPSVTLKIANLGVLKFRTSVNDKIASLKKQMPVIPTTMVLRERKTPRMTHVHIKGDFTRKGAKVTTGVPAVLPPLKKNQSASRLELAEWLTDPKNPLTARVTINRIWQRYFGSGLVETENDFGTQGTVPSHPQLLDWLASEFMAQGWDTKAMHRLIVTSAVYRQSSHARPKLHLVDPRNRLLSHQNRLRLDAELVRDNALAVSGLLTKKIGGESVFPPQPEGVYAFTQVKKNWRVSQGEDRYRRGIYTYFWRSAPHPGLMAFDASDGNTTCTRRSRSNTPLQALTLLNDEAYYECARKLALRTVREDEDRLEYLFKLCLARTPTDRERQRLTRFVSEQESSFRANPNEVKHLIAGPIPNNVPAYELATWTMVARVLLNLDELITRE